MGKTTGLGDLPVPTLKAILTLPVRTAPFRRALSPAVAVPGPQGHITVVNDVRAGLGTQLSGQRLQSTQRGPARST